MRYEETVLYPPDSITYAIFGLDRGDTKSLHCKNRFTQIFFCGCNSVLIRQIKSFSSAISSQWRTTHVVITDISGINFHCYNQYALYAPELIYFCMCALKQKGNLQFSFQESRCLAVKGILQSLTASWPDLQSARIARSGKVFPLEDGLPVDCSHRNFESGKWQVHWMSSDLQGLFKHPSCDYRKFE